MLRGFRLKISVRLTKRSLAFTVKKYFNSFFYKGFLEFMKLPYEIKNKFSKF